MTTWCTITTAAGEKWINTALQNTTGMPSVLWRCWLGGSKGIRPVKKLSGGVLAYGPADATATHCLLLQ